MQFEKNHENKMFVIFHTCSKASAVYTIVLINLLNSKFFSSTGAPAFQIFNQSKCTAQPGNAILIGRKFGKPVALQCSRKTYILAD